MTQPDRGALALAKAVEAAYAQGQTDYSLEPMARVDDEGQPVGKIKDGDSVIFCCRRGEREIELTEAFTEPQFDRFPRDYLDNLEFVIMTMYHEKFKHLPIAFAPEKVQRPLAQAISEAGLKQFHCAESEKYAHVTFFFNGGENQPFPGEDDLRVPSPKGIPFDLKPELSLPEVSEKVMAAAELGYDFIITNFANGDVIGHTANAEAKLTACHVVSETVARVAEYARQKGYVVLVTADHGNIETLYTEAGKPHVAHTTNQVPFLLIDPQERPATLRDTFSHVAEGGIVCSTGQLGGQWYLNDFDPIMELPANGYLTSFYSGNVDPARLQSLLDYVQKYGIDPAPERVFSLPQVPEAHAYLESAHSFGKVIVVI